MHITSDEGRLLLLTKKNKVNCE
ncbi:unnamed protein product [Victoria cruziana]